MTLGTRLLAGLALVVPMVAPTAAQTPGKTSAKTPGETAVRQQPDSSAELRRAVNAAITGRLRAGEPALLVAIVKAGEVLFASSSGVASKANKTHKARAATADSLFPLGGLSRVLIVRPHYRSQEEEHTAI